MKEVVDRLRADHNELYDRVRTNETKYMPAVDAAHKALAKAEELKIELHDQIGNLSKNDSIQEITMRQILARLDSSDEVRKAHLELAMTNAETLDTHMVKEEKDRRFAFIIFKYIIIPSIVIIGGYMGWLGKQILEIKRDLLLHENSGGIHLIKEDKDGYNMAK